MSVDARARCRAATRPRSASYVVSYDSREMACARTCTANTLSFPFLCGPMITLRVSRPFFQLSGDSGAFLGVPSGMESFPSLSPFLFFLFKNSAPGAKQLPKSSLNCKNLHKTQHMFSHSFVHHVEPLRRRCCGASSHDMPMSSAQEGIARVLWRVAGRSGEDQAHNLPPTSARVRVPAPEASGGAGRRTMAGHWHMGHIWAVQGDS